MALWSDYTWIVVCGCLAAFFTSYGIGANDVANAFGSSVAARTLTMKQALLIATVCEFSGSVLLGEQVTRTVAGGIARLLTFDDDPELYMFGMLCALVSSGTWLLLATYLELPVSTTHSIVGAVMGFALVYGGPSAVVWLEPQSAFPYTSGMVPIVVSWFTSPLLSGLAASLLFVLVRTAILRRENSLQLAFWFLPVIVLFTVFINVYFVLYKGGNERLGWSSAKCAWVSAAVAGGCTLLTIVFAMPVVKRYVFEETNLRHSQQLAELEAHVAEARRMMGGNSKSQLNLGSSNMGGSGVNSHGRPSHSVAAQSVGHAAAAGAPPSNTNGGPVRLSQQGVSHSTLGGVGGGSSSGMLGGSSGGGPRALGGSGPVAFNHPFAEHPGRMAQLQQQQQQQQFSHTSAASLRPSQELQPAGLQQQPRLEHQRSAGAGSSGRSGEPLLSAVAELEPVGEGPGVREGGVAGREAGAGGDSRGYGRSTGAASSGGQREQTGAGEDEAQGRAGHGVQGVQQQQQQQEQQQKEQAPQDAGAAAGPAERPGAGEAAGAGAGANVGQGLQPATGGRQQQALLLQQQQLMQQQLLQQQQHYQQQQQQLQLHAWQPQALGLQAQQLPLTPQGQGPGPMWPAVQQQAAWGGQAGVWPSAQLQLQQQQQQLLPQLAHLQAIQAQGTNVLPLAAAAGNPQAQAQLLQWQQLQLQQLQMLQLQQQQQLRFGAQPHALSRGQLMPGTAAAGAWGQAAANAATGAAGGTAPSAFDPALLFARQNAVGSRPGGGGSGPVGESYEGAGHLGAGSHGYSKGVSGELSPGAREGDPPRASVNGTAGGGEAGGAVGAYDEDDEGQRTGSGRSGGGGGEGGHVHWQKTFDQLKAIVLHGTNVDVHAAITEDPVAQRLHAQAEVFDPPTEHTFKYLQVITAICDSFSHGANDVANAVGPFTAIWYIYRFQRVDYYVGVPVWILVLGGAGIVVGLGTYGYNIMRACGVRLSVITPSRGFCIELSTALVVAVASTYGLPVSTTHCQVGAIAGIGLMEGSAGIHWLLALQFILGWLFTLILTGLLSAALFAAGAYAPSATQGRAIRKYEVAMQELATKLDLIMNRTNTAALSDPATWGNHSAQLEQALATSLAWLRTAQQEGNSRATRPVQHINADTAVEYFTRTINTYTNNSLPFIGGMQAKGQILPRQP